MVKWLIFDIGLLVAIGLHRRIRHHTRAQGWQDDDA